MLAQLLAAEGFSSVEDLVMISEDEFSSIEGFDLELVRALKERATEYLNVKNSSFNKQIEALGVDQDLISMLNLSQDKVLKLAEQGIKTIEDLAELKVKEFVEIIPDSNLTNSEIKDLIELAKKNILEQY